MTPSDDELLAVLAPAFDEPIRSLRRATYRYATSHAIEELRIRLDSGEATVLFKDFASHRLLPDAAAGKPASIYDPAREIATYRSLEGTGVGPRCLAAVSGDDRHWLFLEKVPGVELWQVGEPEVWDAVATWLAGFHDRFEGCLGGIESANPHLVRRDRDDFDRWRRRAMTALEEAPDPRAGDVGQLLGAVELSPVGAPVFLHGELYPSNVLVAGAGAGVRVWPIDWEMAAIGPAAFDLAALVTGWEEPARRRMIERYGATRRRPPVADDLLRAVEEARLHLAVQWLGWTAGWRPPEEHAHDWMAEALDAAARLSR